MTTETRLAQLEKQIMAANTSCKDDSDGDDDDLELFQGRAPKCINQAAVANKRKRELSVNAVSIFDRMSNSHGRQKKGRTTEQELNDEFDQE